ncbi:hypothetical protein ACXZ9C_11470 [Streptococcus agalactiae]
MAASLSVVAWRRRRVVAQRGIVALASSSSLVAVGRGVAGRVVVERGRGFVVGEAWRRVVALRLAWWP